MKKVLLFIVIILCSAQLYSAEPLVKFYLQDGSTKQYNLSDIDNMKFPNAPDTLQLQVITKDSSYYYPVQLIDSVKFAVDNSNENRLHLWHDGFVWDVAIHEIDSILIYYTTHVAVTIGEQHWMYRNLNVDHYRNGDSIPEVRDSQEWGNLKTDAWCYYNNDPANEITYGKLYNWHAVNDPRGLALEGWHVPTDAEWTKLTTYLGGLNVAGGKMKETGTFHWLDRNIGATNESGFTALPGGAFSVSFSYLATGGIWWASTESSSTSAWSKSIYGDYITLSSYGMNKLMGYSIRCVKDK